MVLRAVNPKRLAAVCWSVDVVKGGRGRVTFSVTLTSATRNGWSLIASMTARVAASDREHRLLPGKGDQLGR